MSDVFETRSYAIEQRDIREVRDGFDFRGYAAVFEARSRPMMDRSGTFVEVIKQGAFARAISEGQDVLFTRDHDPKQLLGRTSSGTVSLVEDSRGLEVRATLPNTTLGRDTAEMISRRDLNGMSFMFIPAAGGSTYEMRGSERVRTLSDFARVPDVCVTAMPAYPATEVDLEARMMWEMLAELREGKAISAANKDIISNAIAALQALIADEQAEQAEAVNPRMLILDLAERYGATGIERRASAESRDTAYVPQPYAKDADETIQCPVDGSYNSLDARYCDQCGAYLVGQFIVEP